MKSAAKLALPGLDYAQDSSERQPALLKKR
jgi:hypothetical protein